MDLPPSGWYPDPYGTPSLLRWWDGSGWTQHTHPDVTAGAGADGDPAATAVRGAAVEATALQGTAVQDAVRATTVQPSVQSTALQATTVQSATGQPSAEQLSRTKPPTGPPTQPQPALPASPGAAAATATAFQATAAVSGAYQPTMVQPGYPQPGTGWGPAGGADGPGTQVLGFGGEPWQAPGVPGGPAPGNPYGYQDAQRRRRRRLIGGLTAGAVVTIAVIAVLASNLGNSPSIPVSDQSATVPPPSPAATAPSPATTTSASASASPTATASGLVTDAQSGLSYNQLPSPWQATAACPSTLNNGAFPWTDGEYATAGQVNGNSGPVTWYGEACSGPLPQQYYNYTGTADLQTAADTLASTFENAYYGALNHSIAPGQDTPIQVSGHPAWEVTYDVTYTSASAQGATWTDEQAAVVVVDTGTATPAVFFVSIPSTLNESYIASLVSSLQLTAPPSSQPSNSTPSNSTPAGNGGGGSNGGGGGNGGGNGGPHP